MKRQIMLHNNIQEKFEQLHIFPIPALSFKNYTIHRFWDKSKYSIIKHYTIMALFLIIQNLIQAHKMHFRETLWDLKF